MATNRVYLVPGFMSSDLTVAPNGPVIWWDPNVATVLGIGALRLAPNGIDPGPPDGLLCGLNRSTQNPWTDVLPMLQSQLGRANWTVEVDGWDWRKDLGANASNLANVIRANSSVGNPGTIVGHSAGGLLACLVWARLKATGDENLVRRIISICSPFQGSYSPVEFLTGSSATAQQLLLFATAVSPTSQAFVSFTQRFLNALVFTWPAFYELMPSVAGPDALVDPNRALLYDAANWPAGFFPDANWLNFAATGFQPGFQGPDTFPPSWVFTCVVSTGVQTSNRLNVANVPVALGALGQTVAGDGVVPVTSQTRSPGQLVLTSGAHASVPLGITLTGLLSSLIRDPRGPLTPPPPPINTMQAIQANTADPPQADPLYTLPCLSGG